MIKIYIIPLFLLCFLFSFKIIAVPSPCPGTAIEGTAYSCAHASASDEFWYVDDTNTTCGWIEIQHFDGTLVGTPGVTDVGSCLVTYQHVDGSLLGTQYTLSMVVSALNDPPVITPIEPLNVLQDESLAVMMIGTDPEGDSLTWAFDASNTCSWLTITAATGVVSGTPNDDQVGSCNLAVITNDGTVNSSVFSTTVTVYNQQPVLFIQNTTVDSSLGPTVIRTDAEVQANEEGLGGYSLQNAIAQVERCSDQGVVSINAVNGAVTFDPDASFSGI